MHAHNAATTLRRKSDSGGWGGCMLRVSAKTKSHHHRHHQYQSRQHAVPTFVIDADDSLSKKRKRTPEQRDQLLRLMGNASEFKEGDQSIGVAADSDLARAQARHKLASILLQDLLDSRVFLDDEVSEIIMQTTECGKVPPGWTVGDLRLYLLAASTTEQQIKDISVGLTSEAIAAVAKLMTNQELIEVSSRIYNPLPGGADGRCTVGSKGYFGSRLQPNSATDDPEEILISTLEGLSYGCGDVILGINPCTSEHQSITVLEKVLKDVIDTFRLSESGVTRWTVLAHIEDQVKVGNQHPGLVQTLFQSIGGTATLNNTFNFNNSRMLSHLSQPHVSGAYFETGQGSACTNCADHGIDMVTCEARAYGLARAYKRQSGIKWVICNDVAGFIGPEVFRTRDQLLRACLEDLFMGKMHGLTMGLDICSTYHMGIEIDDLDYIMEQVMKAGPAFYMAVPGKNDPMLSYLTSSFRDHPRLRKRFGRTVSDSMRQFLVETLHVMDPDTCEMIPEKAGDTVSVYVAYKRRKGDHRPEHKIRDEARKIVQKCQERGMDIGHGHDGEFGMPDVVRQRLYDGYQHAKRVLYCTLRPQFESDHSAALRLHTLSRDRDDYIAHPTSGEMLTRESLIQLRHFRSASDFDNNKVQVVVSEGLNAEAIDEPGQLEPFLRTLVVGMSAKGWYNGAAAREIIVNNGRVRAGYLVGKVLFGVSRTKFAGDDYDCEQAANNQDLRAIVHIVGERPGNNQNTFSAYVSCVPRAQWAHGISHDVVRVVSGISKSATQPEQAAQLVLGILEQKMRLHPPV